MIHESAANVSHAEEARKQKALEASAMQLTDELSQLDPGLSDESFYLVLHVLEPYLHTYLIKDYEIDDVQDPMQVLRRLSPKFIAQMITAMPFSDKERIAMTTQQLFTDGLIVDETRQVIAERLFPDQSTPVVVSVAEMAVGASVEIPLF